MHGGGRIELLGGARVSANSLVASSASDERLLSLVRPAGHANPTPDGRYDLVVIGAGTAGLVAAIGAGILGARVALVEQGLLGGDCLNFGCVPSKALLRAASAAHEMRAPKGRFGLCAAGVDVDFPAVMESMRRARATAAPHDSVAQVSSFGVQVFLGSARFVARDIVEVDGARLRFRRAIVATGARAAVPHINGLSETGFHTNETIFSLTSRPEQLIVLGGGPEGCELAQAFQRLGSQVTIVQSAPKLLPREDDDVAAIIADRLRAEGVRVLENAVVSRVERRGARRAVMLKDGLSLECDELLVATGRAPNVDALGLDVAGVALNGHGVQVDDRLRSTNARVFAAGDVASAYKFTHAADALARIALQNALFFLRRRASALVVPWCTFTDPEVAHVGITSREAAARGGVSTLTLDLGELDRAIVDDDGPGLARLHVGRRGKLLGATLVAQHAGEAIGPIVLAMTGGLSISQIGRAIAPYPTRLEIWKRLADQHAMSHFTRPWRRLVARILSILR
jgi:pyruvate/2-oxoglutarate dehydrogenase complex dihydrolipoamide dehydrogenase (E3) component